jgi:hypothetical protein
MNLLKKFNDYFDLLEESFNTPYPVNWTISNNNMIGLFTSKNGIEYKISCYKQIGNNWSFTFHWFNSEIDKWDSELIKISNDQFGVLSTIRDSMYELYGKKTPNSIIFSAIDKNELRKSLYKKFSNEFCYKNNYDFINRSTNYRDIFVLLKKNLSDSDREDIMTSVIKIIEIGKSN